MIVSWPAVVLPAVLAGLVAVGALAARHKKDFLARVPALETEADLGEFKRLVARDMWSTLGLIAASLSSVGLAVTAVALGWMRFFEAPVVLAAWSVALTPLGAWHLRIEGQLKALPAADDLLAERDRVVRAWTTRAIPDWEFWE
jgi:hypothetical protein